MVSVEKKNYDITVYKTKEEAAITLEVLKAYKEQIFENELGNFLLPGIAINGTVASEEVTKWLTSIGYK